MLRQSLDLLEPARFFVDITVETGWAVILVSQPGVAQIADAAPAHAAEGNGAAGLMEDALGAVRPGRLLCFGLISCLLLLFDLSLPGPLVQRLMSPVVGPLALQE
jgi:hypothetical protein